MLLDITIENFRSIKDTQTISFEAVRDRRLRSDHTFAVGKKLNLLTFAAVIGPNGAGKSTVIRALEMLQGMILAPESEENPLIRLSGSSFAFDAYYKDSPTTITVKIVSGVDQKSQEAIIYCYTLSADDVKVFHEELSVRVGRSTRLMFERSIDQENSDEQKTVYTYRWGKKYDGQKKRFANKLTERQLFLGASARAGSPSLDPVYSWFSQRLIVIPIGLSHLSETYVIDLIESEPRLAECILEFLHAMDMVDIRDLRVVRKEGESPRLVYIHGNGASRYASYFSSESLGTRRMTMIAAVMRIAMERPTFLLADDFTLLLHEAVKAEVFEKFVTQTAGVGSQMMTSGVDLSVLNEGSHRHDEIWLTSKIADGSTTYYSLADYVIRKKDSVRDMYLQGAFGAVPIIAECLYPTGNKEE